MKRTFYLLVGAALVVVVGYLALTGKRSDTVRIGGKKFTEGYVMAEMISAVLEAQGLAVEEKFDMGSGIVRDALEHGQVDLYWEYTGTAYVMHHQLDDPAVMRDPRRVYDAVKRLDAEQGLVWLDPAAFNNTYTLIMTQEQAGRLNVRTVSDLAAYVTAHPEAVTLASNAEWLARPDGFKGLGAHYDFEFPPGQVVKMEAGLIYFALRDGEVDVGMGYSTDARILALNLVNLEDDRSFFPIYNPAPVVRAELLEQHPGLGDKLNRISRLLTDESITRLNYLVDIEQQTPQQAARDWLREQGLL